MPALFRLRSKSTVTTKRRVVNNDVAVDYGMITRWLWDVEEDVQKLCAVTHRPYQSLLTEARRYLFSSPPEHLQKLVDTERSMDAILRALRRAGDPIHNPTTSKLLLMDWQARYIWVKCRIEKIRGDPSSDTVPSLIKDHDFDARIDAVLHYFKRHMTSVLLDIDSTLRNVDRDVVYAMEGADPDITNVGTCLTAAALAQHQADLQNEILTHHPDRDHRVSCAVCLERYTDTQDPAFELACGHIVGETCMAAWLASAHALAPSCPHCKHTLCPPRERREYLLLAPMPGEVRRYDALLACHDLVGWHLPSIFDSALEVYGKAVAMEAAKRVVESVSADLARNGSQFRVDVQLHGSEGFVTCTQSYCAVPRTLRPGEIEWIVPGQGETRSIGGM